MRVEARTGLEVPVSLQKWETLERKPLLRNRILAAYQDRLRSPRGAEFDFFVLEAPDWVNVIALTPAGEVVLVRQYRHGTREISTEIPGGMVDPGEAPLEAARRELREETGYTADSFELLGVVAPNPAFQTNRTHTFLARGARLTSAQHTDPAEEIEVSLAPLAAIPGLLRDGTIRHSLVHCAFTHLWLRGGLDPGRSA